MLLSEELTLLALDPETGKLRCRDAGLDEALAGALLLDLAKGDTIALVGDTVVLGHAPPRHPVLGMGLSRLTGQVPVRVRDAIHHLAPFLADNLLESMAERRIVLRDEHRTLVLKLLIRWHAASPEASDGIRTDLAGLLARLLAALDSSVPSDEQGPMLSERSCGLLTVLGGADLLELVGPSPGPDATARARAWCAEVARGESCAHAVPADLVAFQTAVFAALSASVRHPAEPVG